MNSSQRWLASVILGVLVTTTANANELVNLPLNEGSGAVVYDSSGSGNNGSLSGSPIFDTDTADGSAFSLRFDGSDDYIDLGVINVPGAELTVAARFKAEGFSRQLQDSRLISKASGLSAAEHIHMLSTIKVDNVTRLRGRVRVDGISITLIANSGDISLNTWYHAALTYDGTSLKLYLDGVVVGNFDVAGQLDSGSGIPLAIGAQPGGTRHFDGLIDDVRISATALSAQDIATIIAGDFALTASNDSYQLVQDNILSVDANGGVLSNDSTGNTANAQLVTPASSGTIHLNADGSFTYTPNPGYTGTDTFSYQINAESESSNIADVTLSVNPIQAADNNIYLSSTTGGRVTSANSNVPFLNEDIISYDQDTGDWALFFDGSDVGLNGDVNAFSLLEDGSLLLSVKTPVSLPGVGQVDDSDIIRFVPATTGEQTSGSIELYFDGSDVGLSSSAEDIHGLSILDNGDLLISTNGNAVVPGLAAFDEDVLRFSPTQLGDNTAGTWSLYLDGSAVDLKNSNEDIWALSASATGLHISTLGSFVVPDANGKSSDILLCAQPTVTSCAYELAWEGSQLGIGAENIDALSTGTRNVVVANAAPQAVADSYTSPQDTELQVDVATGVLANDSDSNGDTLQATLVNDVAAGHLVLNSNGSFNYTPTESFTGAETFTYVANDGQEDSDEVTVTLAITAPNGPPAAIADNYTTNAGSSLQVSAIDGVLANDVDAEADPLTALLDTDPSHGKLSLAADGSFTYTPDSGFSGDDSFSYTAHDSISSSASAIVNLTVNPPPPEGSFLYLSSTSNGTVATPEGTLSYRDEDILLYNTAADLWSMYFDGSDMGIAGDVNAFSLLDDGSLLLSLTAEANIPGVGLVDDSDIIRFIPESVGDQTTGSLELYFDGSDVGLSTSGEDIYALAALDDNSIVISTNGAVKVPGVTAADEDLLRFVPTQLGDDTIGSWSLYADGSAVGLSSTAEDIWGVSIKNDTIHMSTYGAFSVSGASGNESDILTCRPTTPGDTASCDFSIQWQGQSAGFGSESIDALTVIELLVLASNDNYEVTINSSLTVSMAQGVLANDLDTNAPTGLSAALITGPDKGSVDLNSDGSFTYTPDNGFSGTDSFNYKAIDSEGFEDQATVTIDVTVPNGVPEAIADSYLTEPGSTLQVDAAAGVLANDTDPNQDPLTARLIDDTEDGSLTLNNDGSFEFIATAGHEGQTSFSYVANDGQADSNITTVTLTVEDINHAPLALADDYEVEPGIELTVPATDGVLANDNDANQDELTAQLVTNVQTGELTLNTDGSLSFTPPANYAGGASFTYIANDGVNDSAEATVTFSLPAQNTAPTALADAYGTQSGITLQTSATLGLLANDTDNESDPLTARLLTDVTNGTLELETDGSFVYTPDTEYTGIDSFTYEAWDGQLASTGTTVEITVTATDPSQLVHLPLNEGSGNVATNLSGADGTITGGPLYLADTADGSNYALQLDGVNDHIDLGTLDVLGSELTIASWIKPYSFPGSGRDPRIVSKASGNTANAHIFMLSTIQSGNHTRLRARVRVNDVTTTLIASSGNLTTNSWQHATATYNGSILKLFLNGTEVGSTALSGVIDTDSSINTFVGAQPSGGKNFDGLIDDVRVLDRALNITEIQDIVGSIPATAQFTASPQTATAPVDVTFDASGSNDPDGQIVSYSWDFGDQTTASGPTANHTYTVAGNYLVTLTIVDDQDFTSQTSTTISVNNGTTPGTGTGSWRLLSTKTGDIPIPSSNAPHQTVALSFDINLDGVNDFLIGTRRATTGPSIEWWEYTATGWITHTIETDYLPLEAGGDFHDIDGDGDIDFVIGEDGAGDKIYWWENPYPSFDNRWTRREVKNSLGKKHHDQVFGDFDGDGAIELAYWNNKADFSLLMSEIPADPSIDQEWQASVIFNADYQSEGLAVADVDGDGLPDLIGAGYWFKYTNGTYVAQEIDGTQGFTRVVAGQVIAGGRPEVVFDSGDSIGRLVMYAWNGSTWVSTDLLGEDSEYGHSLAMGDVNQDGHLDIMSGEMHLGTNNNPELRMLYGDGLGSFTLEIIATGIDNHESKLVDLDNDGDLDILGKPYREDAGEINIWLNEPAPVEPWSRIVLDDSVPHRTIFVEHGDIDGDGFEDLITGAWWWKNPGVPTGEWVRNTIGTKLNQMAAVSDFDQDGDLDVIGTEAKGSSANSTMHWARNDGNGNFTIHSNIGTAEGTFLQGVTVGQYQSGVTEIALSWQNCIGGLQMVTVPPANSIESQTWSTRVISADCSGEGLDTGDIDNDGDNDFLDGVSWYRNDGNGAFSQFALTGTTSGQPDRNILVDMDFDGDLDVVVGFGHDPDKVISWFEQGTNPEALWTQHLIDNLIDGTPQSVDVADLDGDGNHEIVVGEHHSQEPPGLRLRLYSQGAGNTWQSELIHAGDEHHDGAQFFDADNDGDLDVVSIGWKHRRLMLYVNNSAPVTPPVTGAPLQLSAMALSDTSVVLNWNPPAATEVANYRIYRDDVLVTTVTDTRWSDTVAANAADYDYRVEAITTDGATSQPALISVGSVSSVDGIWWDTNWPYRLLLGVSAEDFIRQDRVIETPVDFTAILSSLGVSDEINTSTIRCHAVNSDGLIIGAEIPCQFEPATPASLYGQLILLATGTTSPGAPRYFHVYFDTAGGASTGFTYQPLVQVTDDVMDENQLSFRINTSAAEYFYQKQGAGFSSLIDSEGKDWINYSTAPGVTGSFRGIPNMVHPEGEFHPGATGSTSVLISSGPVKARVQSTTTNGLWDAIWTFYPNSVQMTVLAADHDFWFLYEGTPGGVFQPANDLVVRSNGVSNTVSQNWTEDLADEEWVYIADPGLARSLFFVKHEDDTAIDSYRSGSDQMTILGFGREGVEKRISNADLPAHFSLGLIDSTDFSSVQQAIDSLIEPVTSALSQATTAP